MLPEERVETYLHASDGQNNRGQTPQMGNRGKRQDGEDGATGTRNRAAGVHPPRQPCAFSIGMVITPT